MSLAPYAPTASEDADDDLATVEPSFLPLVERVADQAWILAHGGRTSRLLSIHARDELGAPRAGFVSAVTAEACRSVLTPDELIVVELAAAGFAPVGIARRLGWSRSVVRRLIVTARPKLAEAGIR